MLAASCDMTKSEMPDPLLRIELDSPSVIGGFNPKNLK